MNRILLANAHPFTQSALALMLRTRLPDADILAATHWGELLPLAEKHRPVLVLLDRELPGCTAEQGLAALQGSCPGVKVILLGTQAATGNGDAAAFFSCLEPPERLLAVVQSALAPTLTT
jgi:DNA-binding NarL/FixJ family response regulator